MKTARLYYEAHITIDPVFDEARANASVIGEAYKFKLAHLLMQKRERDTPEMSKHDTFMTGHGVDYDDILDRCRRTVKALKDNGFVVRRAKIEDTLLDTKMGDILGEPDEHCH